MFIDGCLFEGGYATIQGAGVSQDKGNISILGSVFYNNVAGGDNEKNGE